MTRIQRYIRPASVDEAVSLKSELGATAFYLAGGTDALVLTPSGATTAIDIMRLSMDDIAPSNGFVDIGATARLRDVERHPAIRGVAMGALVEAIRETGPWLIRNQGTLVGNICNASPSADSAPMLLALDAEALLSDGSVVPLDSFFAGPHRTILSSRLMTSIRIHPKDRSGHFQKLSRSKSDIAQVNLAVTGRIESGVIRDARIALGSVAPTPVRAKRAEALLEGQRVDRDLIELAVAAVQEEISPIDDWRATAAYRLHSAGVMVRRSLRSVAS